MRSIATLSIIALAAINSFKVDARPTTVKRASLLANDSVNVTVDSRADAVRQAFLHGWNGYVTYAFGHDELLPVSMKPSDSR